VALQVGELYALLKLDDAKFKKSLEDAERRMSDLAKKSSAAFAAIAGSITAAAIAGGRYADQMQAIAGQTGLAVESVQALSHAAMRFNADLGLLQTSLRAFVRRSAEAAQGNMSFLQTFQMLGISQDEVAAGLHDIEGLFLLVAERISRLPTEAQRSAAAMQLLGDAGRQLVPMLSQGAAGIREAMQEARRLGIVTDRETIAALADFASELDVMRAQLAGATRSIVAEFIPTLRPMVQLISQASASVANLGTETRSLIGTIGVGTVGAVGSMAALTTGTWAAVRAWQALSTTLRLAAGPAGWIALVASAVVSLTVGLSLASMQARNLRQDLSQFATVGDIDRELERVNAQIAETEARIAELREQLTTPVIGGPRITFEAAPEGQGGLLDQLEDLRALRDALVARRSELERLEEQQKAFLESLNVEITDTSAESSAAFRRWEERVRDVNRELDLFLAGMAEVQNRIGAAVDQEQWLRDAAQERVRSLEAEIRAREEIARLTRDVLDDGKLLPEEVDELTFALAMAEVEAGRLRAELTVAAEQLRLGRYAEPFEAINHLARLIRSQFDLGIVPLETLADRAADLVRRTEKLNDGTLTWLTTLQNVKNVHDEIMASLPQAISRETLPRQMPRPLVAEQALENELRRLELRVDAGLIPMEDALAALHRLRMQLIELTQASGGLYYANNEQLRLYNELTRAIDRLVESLETAPSRLDEIRAERGRALGIGMELERQLTGIGFDPLSYQIDVLTQSIREMFAVTDAITPEMEELIWQVKILRMEQAALTQTESVVRAGIEAFGRNLGPLGRVLAQSITFTAGPGLTGSFGFNASGFMTSALTVGIDLLFQALSGMNRTGQMLEQVAQALEQASQAWSRTLANAQFHELVTADPESMIADLIAARNALIEQIENIERFGGAHQRAQLNSLKAQLAQIEAEIEAFQSGAGEQLENRIRELLGITTRGLQSAVAAAFSASTAEDFARDMEGALTSRVRSAFVTAFLESAAMAPLFEQLGDMIREALVDIDISPEEMRGIREIMDEIKTRSTPLYELLEEMGLLADATERVREEFGALRNVPAIFKTALVRGQIAVPMPLADGGIVTQPTVALVGERGREAVIPLNRLEQIIRRAGQTSVHVSIQGPIYGQSDLDRLIRRSVREALRHEMSVQYGV